MSAHLTYAQKGGKVEALRIAYITERLKLTAEEAKTFWPVYNRMRAELTELRQRYKYVLKAEPEDLERKSEADSERMIADLSAFKQGQVDIYKKYNAEFRKIISAKRILLLYKAEEDFKRELIKRLQDQSNRPYLGDD